MPEISTERIWVILQEAGFRWQKSRTWCETGQVARKRKCGVVMVTEAAQKKELIETAYREGEKMGLAVWVEDEAGPYQTYPIRAKVGNQKVNQSISRTNISETERPSC